MGMVDELTCNYPLPDTDETGLRFQTKDLDCLMMDYTISEAGRLILHKHTREWFEDEGSIIGGYYRIVSTEDVDTGFHGDLVFYRRVRDENALHEYKARFTHGAVEWVKRLELAR